MSQLHLADELRAKLEAWIQAGYPHETCGLLVGRQEEGTARVERVYQARNLNQERARDRYDMDPEDQLQVELEAREAGLDVVGIWHSHPDHPARPSETDRSKAWPGWSYLIVSVTAEGVVDLRSFRLAGEEFVEEDVP